MFSMYIRFWAVCLFAIGSDSGYAQKTISAKTIEEKMAKVNDSLYACRYETTNGEYNSFLNAIAKKDSALYIACLIDSLGWHSVLSYGEPMVNYYHRHPAFTNYPVVNVSYEGAVEYCRWLTELYNSDAKRKFKKVVFELPEPTDWTFTARAGKPGRRYPWGNYSLRNKKGMYLCNCKRISEEFVIADSLGKPVFNESDSGYYPSGRSDGGFYTASVNTFWPNDFGIYNMSGNVCEMTRVKGYVMGGSWNSYGGEVTTTSMKKFDEPSPEAGFRVFMKVLEY